MVSIRQAKNSRLIQRELGHIFLTEGKIMFPDSIISVTRVIVSPDLGYAKVYLSFLNVDDHESVLSKIRSNAKELKRILVSRIRHQVRKMPELTYFYDDTLDYVEKMDKIFKDLNQGKNKNGK